MILAILIFLVALVAIVIATINIWLPKVIKIFVEKKSNFPTNVQVSKCSVTKGVIDLEGINLKNPKGKFEEENFLTVNKLFASVDYKSLTTKQIVIPEVVINVENLTCEKNKDGDINAMVLANSFTGGEETDEEKKKKEEEEKKKEEEEEKKEDAEKKESKSFIIRKLTIHLGSIVINNLIASDGEHKFDLNKTLNFENVTPENKKDIISQILNDPDLQNASVKAAMETALGQGKKFVDDAVNKAKEETEKAAKQAAEKAKEEARKAAEKAQEEAKRALSKAEEKIKANVPDDVAKKVEQELKKVIPNDASKKAEEQIKKVIPNDAAKKAEEAAKKAEEKVKNALTGGLKSLFG